MGVRGELFSARVRSDNDRRTYFFNVKENRNRDLFLTVVESKKTEGGEEHERHQVVVFEEDLYLFSRGFERVMEFIREHRDETVMPRERPEEDGGRSRARGGDFRHERGGAHGRYSGRDGTTSGDRDDTRAKDRGGTRHGKDAGRGGWFALSKDSRRSRRCPG